MFLRNRWYVAAWDHEVLRLNTMRRIVLNEPVLLYRDSNGRPVALEDRCCHRHAPLSMGRLRGDHIECRYHGLRFDSSGACVHIPWQDAIPREARVRAYPVIERHHWIWIWMGDPALADPETIEDFHWMDDPDWRFRGELLRVEGNYMLIVENLCDLSHLEFLHSDSLGTTAVRSNPIPIRYAREGERVRVERHMLDDDVPGYFRVLGNLERGVKVDRWMHLDFSPPGFVRLDIGAQPAGRGAREGRRDGDITTRNLNAITPETETTTHYFWAQAQNFANEDASLSELDFSLTHGAFQQDLAIIKGQQDNTDLDATVPRLNIATDSGGIQARRIIEELIEKERAAGTG